MVVLPQGYYMRVSMHRFFLLFAQIVFRIDAQNAHFVRSHATLGDLSVAMSLQDGPVQRTCPVAAWSRIQSYCLRELHLGYSQTRSMEELNL